LKTAHSVRVLGRDISVRSSAPAEKVHAVETFVNDRLQEIGSVLKSGDAQLVLSLSLLNTAEELLDLRAARETDTTLENRVLGMIARLESA
jgi:cell division protein ZapA